MMIMGGLEDEGICMYDRECVKEGGEREGEI